MPTGYACQTCRKWHELGPVVDQTVGVLIVRCDKCGAKHSVVAGNVMQVRRGRVPRRVSEKG